MMQKNKKLNIVKFFNTRKVYTCDKNVIGKSGVYEDVEWSKTRKIGSTFYSNSSSKNYYEMIFNDISKISAANTLSIEFDFSKFNKIGDIGGVPFSQVWTIKKLYPHLKFYLTDYDGIFKNFIRGIINYFENLIGRVRYHGVLRNQEYFENICNSVCIKLKLVCVANNYRIYLINS